MKKSPQTLMQGKPPYIYKYCAASRAIQILNDLSFYFTPARQLNDLYEFRAKSLYTEEPESRFRTFAKRLIADGWFDETEKAIEMAKEMDRSDVDEAYSYFIQQLTAVLERTMEHSGVTCFSGARNNQRMWGTYGDNHAGACIEFHAADGTSNFSDHLMPVLYMDRKIPICPSELMTECLTIDQWMLGVFCCIKHHHWRDEEEWRLLLLADSHQSTQERIVPFERRAISRIFLGPRISSENETAIHKAAKKHHPPIGVFKRKIDETEAKEEHVGFEVINSFEQLRYWCDRNKA